MKSVFRNLTLSLAFLATTNAYAEVTYVQGDSAKDPTKDNAVILGITYAGNAAFTATLRSDGYVTGFAQLCQFSTCTNYSVFQDHLINFPIVYDNGDVDATWVSFGYLANYPILPKITPTVASRRNLKAVSLRGYLGGLGSGSRPVTMNFAVTGSSTVTFGAWPSESSVRPALYLYNSSGNLIGGYGGTIISPVKLTGGTYKLTVLNGSQLPGTVLALMGIL